MNEISGEIMFRLYTFMLYLCKATNAMKSDKEERGIKYEKRYKNFKIALKCCFGRCYSQVITQIGTQEVLR